MSRASTKGLAAIGVVLLGVGSVAQGQMPAIPGVPPIPGAAGGLAGGAGDALAAGPGAVAAAAPAQRTIWGFFGITPQNCAACRQRICASPLGAMLNGLLGPGSAMTGGLVPMFCPAVPTDAQLAALAAAGGPTGAEAVAAKIKQDEADAKARRAAIRYLSTASCHYWPEAEAAIIGGLRDDRNECVRYEAALALLNGCCCTAKTIEALDIVVSGSEKDGKPSELSERVKAVSLAALQGCLQRFHPPAQPIPLERPEPASASSAPEELPPGFERVAYYYRTIKDVPPELIVAEARRTVERARASGESTTMLTGKRTVYHALARATTPTPTPPRPESPSPDSTAAPEPPLIPTPTSTPPAVTTSTKVPTPTLDKKGDGIRLTSTTRSDPLPALPQPQPQRRGLSGFLDKRPPLPARTDLKRKDADKPAPTRAQTQSPSPSPTTGRRNLRDIFVDSLSSSGGR
jgi:hypothetical protein